MFVDIFWRKKNEGIAQRLASVVESRAEASIGENLDGIITSGTKARNASSDTWPNRLSAPLSQFSYPQNAGAKKTYLRAPDPARQRSSSTCRAVIPRLRREPQRGLALVGAEGTILWANRTELDMLGFASEEYIGQHIAEFYVDQVIEDILQR